MRAEVVRFLLTVAAPAVSAQAVARSAGFAKRNVHDALAALHAAGVVSQWTVGNEQRYAIDRSPWTQLLGIEREGLPQERAWPQLLAGLQTLRRWLHAPGLDELSDYLRASQQLIGYVTKAIIDEGHCTGGSGRVLTETLPWHIRYAGFTGTLPRIQTTTLAMVGGAFQLAAAGAFCLFTSSAASPVSGIVNVNTTNGVAESMRIDELSAIPLTSGGGLCGSSGRLTGTSTRLGQENTATKITVTLVQ